MYYNVAQLLKSPVGTTRNYDIAEDIARIEGMATVGTVTGHAKLVRTKRGVLVDARIDTVVVLECSRCLEAVQTPLSVHIQEEFIPTTDITTGLHVELDAEDDEAFRIDEDHILGLEEPLRQYALLGVPLQPLCGANCRGLCALCGANLNVTACNCREATTDERLSPLARLLGQLEV